jgi:cytochrome c556
MSRGWSARAGHGLLVLLGLGCVERPRAPAQSGADGRQVTPVPLEARDAVRAEMRTMLGSLHDILKASMVNDTSAMREAATRSGLASAADPALEKLLPEGFLQLGVNTHQQFDDLAGALQTGIPRDSVVGRLTRITGNCVSCHATYRLELR